MTSSSSVGITKIRTREPFPVISVSALRVTESSFFTGSITMPSSSRPCRHFARVIGPRSPTPAVNTMASTVPRAAAYAPRYFFSL